MMAVSSYFKDRAIRRKPAVDAFLTNYNCLTNYINSHSTLNLNTAMMALFTTGFYFRVIRIRECQLYFGTCKVQIWIFDFFLNVQDKGWLLKLLAIVVIVIFKVIRFKIRFVSFSLGTDAMIERFLFNINIHLMYYFLGSA